MSGWDRGVAGALSGLDLRVDLRVGNGLAAADDTVPTVQSPVIGVLTTMSTSLDAPLVVCHTCFAGPLPGTQWWPFRPFVMSAALLAAAPELVEKSHLGRLGITLPCN